MAQRKKNRFTQERRILALLLKIDAKVALCIRYVAADNGKKDDDVISRKIKATAEEIHRLSVEERRRIERHKDSSYVGE